MPPKRGFKRPIPSSTRKLRPLPRRISSVEKTIDFVEDLINFEPEEDKKILLVVIKIVLVAKIYLLVLEHLTHTITVTIWMI